MTASIIPMPVSEDERLWRVYLAAKEKADRTGSIDDAIAAGKAWAAFLKSFEAAS